MEEVRIPVGGTHVSASVHGEGPTLVALGHGAGGNRKAPFLLRVAEGLAASGRRALLYNFQYTEQGRRVPDRPEALEATTRAVGDYALSTLGAARLVHGGKSMGGRIASQVVAAGAPAAGLVFLGYPLHPPGRTETRRDRHLPSVPCPMLFVQGTRDAFAQWALIEELLGRLGAKATLYRVEDGDHSFAVRKGSGRSKADVEAEILKAVVGWLAAREL